MAKNVPLSRMSCRHSMKLFKEMKKNAVFFLRFKTYYYLCSRKRPSGLFFVMGLTGFDGEMKWYASTRWLEGFHLNLSFQQINWQHTVCSRCLIEAQ